MKEVQHVFFFFFKVMEGKTVTSHLFTELKSVYHVSYFQFLHSKDNMILNVFVYLCDMRPEMEHDWKKHQFSDLEPTPDACTSTCAACWSIIEASFSGHSVRLKAIWLNSTTNFHTTIAEAVWNQRLYGSNLKAMVIPFITMRHCRHCFHM